MYSLFLTLCRCVATLRGAFFGASLDGMHFFIFGGLFMKCENEFCIYQENGDCIIDDISLDAAGCCTECINISLNKNFLTEIKKQIREKLKFDN